MQIILEPPDFQKLSKGAQNEILTLLGTEDIEVRDSIEYPPFIIKRKSKVTLKEKSRALLKVLANTDNGEMCLVGLTIQLDYVKELSDLKGVLAGITKWYRNNSGSDHGSLVERYKKDGTTWFKIPPELLEQVREHFR